MNKNIIPKSLKNFSMHYCQGCGHRIINVILGEVIDELNVREETILLSSVGCSILLYDYFNCDVIECAHGRAPAVATGVKRVHPDKLVLLYQGDGDLASIGIAEIIHAAIRGESITVIFVNNAIYGMTGGQMAPTTIPNQKTTTSPNGKITKDAGEPLNVCELLSSLKGVKYLERCSVNSPTNIKKAKNAIKNAIKNQAGGNGFSLVEILSMCPTGWKMSPRDAVEFIDKKMLKYFPLGKIKDK